MTPKQFVDAVHAFVLRAAVSDVLATVDPNLPEEQRALARSIALATAHHALFGMSAVLDGVRAVENTRNKGSFKLTFRKDGTETLLNPTGGEMLHDLRNDAVADADA